MNNKGQVWSIVLIVALVFILVAFTTIEPLKESLDNNRGGDTLNCVGTTTFNQANFTNQSSFERLVYRPTCWVTGMSMLWFVVGFILAVFVWAVHNIKKLTSK